MVKALSLQHFSDGAICPPKVFNLSNLLNNMNFYSPNFNYYPKYSIALMLELRLDKTDKRVYDQAAHLLICFTTESIIINRQREPLCCRL